MIESSRYVSFALTIIINIEYSIYVFSEVENDNMFRGMATKVIGVRENLQSPVPPTCLSADDG